MPGAVSRSQGDPPRRWVFLKMRDDIALVTREYINTTGAAVLVAESNPEYVKFATYVYRIHRGVATLLEKIRLKPPPSLPAPGPTSLGSSLRT